MPCLSFPCVDRYQLQLRQEAGEATEKGQTLRPEQKLFREKMGKETGMSLIQSLAGSNIQLKVPSDWWTDYEGKRAAFWQQGRSVQNSPGAWRHMLY